MNGSQVDPSMSAMSAPDVVLRGDQRDAVRRIGIEVDPGDVALRPGLVALEEEVRAVVIGRIRSLAVPSGRRGTCSCPARSCEPRSSPVGVRGDHHGLAGGVQQVVVVAVVGDRRSGVLDLRRALGDDRLLELRRQHRRGGVALRLRVRRRDARQARPARPSRRRLRIAPRRPTRSRTRRRAASSVTS